MNTSLKTKESFYLKLIGVLSVAIPLAVAFLLFMPQTGKLGDVDVSFLPHLNAGLNSACAFCLIAGLWAIKRKNEQLHRALMMTAFALGSIFLVSYVVYHFQGPKVYYGDFDGNGILSEVERMQAGSMRSFYLFVLLSHIALSVVVVPLVLLSMYFAISEQRAKHRRIVRYAWPIWTYVALSGVGVYLLIRPFYQ